MEILDDIEAACVIYYALHEENKLNKKINTEEKKTYSRNNHSRLRFEIKFYVIS